MYVINPRRDGEKSCLENEALFKIGAKDQSAPVIIVFVDIAGGLGPFFICDVGLLVEYRRTLVQST